ncbi:MAG: hypothetical protein K8S26_10570 [Agrobacterium sp.]|nr:hypothetical protein [Agrobacterium sp.]
MTDKISFAVGAAAGAIVACLLFTTINAVWWLPSAKEEARMVERAELDAATNKAIGELTNEADKARVNRRLCRERGGVYLNATGRCQ